MINSMLLLLNRSNLNFDVLKKIHFGLQKCFEKMIERLSYEVDLTLKFDQLLYRNLFYHKRVDVIVAVIWDLRSF